MLGIKNKKDIPDMMVEFSYEEIIYSVDETMFMSQTWGFDQKPLFLMKYGDIHKKEMITQMFIEGLLKFAECWAECGVIYEDEVESFVYEEILPSLEAIVECP